LIEEGLLNDEVTDRMIVRYLEPLLKDEIDTLVLGCTHYPLLTGAMARVLKRQIMIVDSAHNCARAVEEMLDQQSLRAAPLNNGKLKVALTDAADSFLNVAGDALQLNFGEIEIRALP
jgi:glutamate racemase